MMTDGLSIADAMALAKGEGSEGLSGTWIWVFFLFFLLAWGGNGFFGGMNGGAAAANSPAVQGALTRADLYDTVAIQGLTENVNGIQRGLSDGFYAVNSGIAQNGYQTQLAAQGITQSIAENRYAAQMDTCQTNHNIDSVRYDAAKNSADIIAAINAQGDATRALINANAMQDLRDRLEAKDRDLLAAQFQVSQQTQNNYLISQLSPAPKPAYVVGSPYTSYIPTGYTPC